MLLFQSLPVCLFDCCSFNCVLRVQESLQSGDFIGDIGVSGDGLDGGRISEEVNEFKDEFELLRDILLDNPVDFILNNYIIYKFVGGRGSMYQF